jgi:pectate lyase
MLTDTDCPHHYTRIHHLTNIRLLPTLGVFALVMAAAYMFPSTTHAALPANELWREQLLNQRVGFGRNATGGAGGTLCTVSNLNDSGAGSLRACLTASGPQWIIFSVSGTITLSSQIHMRGALGNNDKTIDGRGQNITINGGSSLHTILLNDVHPYVST